MHALHARLPRAVPALVVACALALPVHAEDAPAVGAGASPPALPDDAKVFVVETAAVSPHVWMAALQTELERLRTPPPTSAQDTQLKSAWETILAPRLPNMIGRLSPWREPERWLIVSGEPGALTLRDDQWAPFIRQIAMLTTELQGALQQYAHVKIRRRVLPTPVEPAETWRLAYPLTGLYSSILQRQAAVQRLQARRVGTHASLFGRFRLLWDWSWDQSSAWRGYVEKLEQAAAQEAIERSLEQALEATKVTLASVLLGVQAFVASVQEAEQARLRAICVACRTDDVTLREMAEAGLRGMEVVQLEAERFQGDNYAKYNGLLRTWHRQQRAAVAVLAVTEKRLADDAPEPAR